MPKSLISKRLRLASGMLCVKAMLLQTVRNVAARRASRQILALAVFSLALPLLTQAQVETGQITGVVLDQTGKSGKPAQVSKYSTPKQVLRAKQSPIRAASTHFPISLRDPMT